MKNRSFFTTFWQKTIDQSEQSFNNIIINLEAKKNHLNFYLTKFQKLRHFWWFSNHVQMTKFCTISKYSPFITDVTTDDGSLRHKNAFGLLVLLLRWEFRGGGNSVDKRERNFMLYSSFLLLCIFFVVYLKLSPYWLFKHWCFLGCNKKDKKMLAYNFILHFALLQ